MTKLVKCGGKREPQKVPLWIKFITTFEVMVEWFLAAGALAFIGIIVAILFVLAFWLPISILVLTTVISLKLLGWA